VIRGTGSLKNKVQHLFYPANAFARLRQIISNRYFSHRNNGIREEYPGLHEEILQN
jgi:hypothetical protein